MAYPGNVGWSNALFDSPDLGGGGDEALGSCKFQFWVDRIESFYCNLEGCSWQSKDSFGEWPPSFYLIIDADAVQTRIRRIISVRRWNVLVYPVDSSVERMAALVSVKG